MSIGPDGYGYSGVTIPTQFVDISGTGNATMQGIDDGDTRLRSSSLSGFTFNFYGTTYSTIYFSSNGLITFGSGTTAYANTDLTSSPSEATIAGLWDDFVISGGAQSAVYWQVVGSGSSQQLIVQWNDVSVYNGAQTGQITFETILNADGTIIFNYKDLDSGDAFAGGASATVGIKASGTQGSDRLLVSYDSASSPYVATGKSLEIGLGLTSAATDYYAFTLDAGQTATIAATGQKSATVSVALENAQGTILASGASPGSGSSVNSEIDSFVAPVSGTYYAVVSGTTGATYSLVVNHDADFGAQTNGSFATAQDITGASGVLSDVQTTTPTENWYAIDLTAGNAILLQTFTFGGGSAQFVDALSPQIQLYSPADVLVASGQGTGNQTLSAAAATTGVYRIRVLGAGGTSGEYFLSTLVDAAPPTATIAPVTPNTRNTPVSQIQIVFSKAVSGVTLADLSLTDNGGPNLLTSSQTLTTSDDITYTLGNLSSATTAGGTYKLSLAANSGITDALGGFLATGATSTFVIEALPPTAAITPVVPSTAQFGRLANADRVQRAGERIHLGIARAVRKRRPQSAHGFANVDDQRRHHVYARESRPADRDLRRLHDHADRRRLRDRRCRRQFAGRRRGDQLRRRSDRAHRRDHAGQPESQRGGRGPNPDRVQRAGGRGEFVAVVAFRKWRPESHHLDANARHARQHHLHARQSLRADRLDRQLHADALHHRHHRSGRQSARRRRHDQLLDRHRASGGAGGLCQRYGLEQPIFSRISPPTAWEARRLGINCRAGQANWRRCPGRISPRFRSCSAKMCRSTRPPPASR